MEPFQQILVFMVAVFGALAVMIAGYQLVAGNVALAVVGGLTSLTCAGICALRAWLEGEGKLPRWFVTLFIW